MNHTEYNQKAFLLPESIHSCASFHAKVFETGDYMFRIHDCVSGVRLRGELNTSEGINEAIGKLEALIKGAGAFKEYIEKNYRP